MTEEAANLEKPVNVPAIAITLQMQLGEGRSMILQTHADSEAPEAVIDAFLDKLTKRIDRQYAKYSLKGLRRQLELHEKTLTRATKDIADRDQGARDAYKASGHRGEMKLSVKDQTDRANAMKSLDRFKEEIVKINIEIAEAEREAE